MEADQSAIYNRDRKLNWSLPKKQLQLSSQSQWSERDLIRDLEILSLARLLLGQAASTYIILFKATVEFICMISFPIVFQFHSQFKSTKTGD